MTVRGTMHLRQAPTQRVAMLCYTSRPIPGLEPSRLRALLQRARTRNRADGITGCLIFDRERVLQLLEGEAGAVHGLYARIAHDPRHERVRLLFDGTAERREFEATPMACHNLAWRHQDAKSVQATESARRAVSRLLAAARVDLPELVAVARRFHFLGLAHWPERAGRPRAAAKDFAHVAMPE